MLLKIILLIFIGSWAAKADLASDLAMLATQAHNPDYFLKKQGPLINLAKSSREQAQIIFLPEVHDDPGSLLTQFLLIASEKKRKTNFIVLDESLTAMNQSMWELFSEKALEIVAARHKDPVYSPHSFETNLQSLATKLRQQPDQLSYVRDPGIWTIKAFLAMSTTFYGWDLANRQSLYERNIQLVKTLKQLIPRYDKILVMLGARHVPELDYLISQRLLCKADQHSSLKDFFLAIKNKPKLEHGIGSTAPIYQFLADKNYAVLFSHSFYKILDKIVDEFGEKKGSCLELK